MGRAAETAFEIRRAVDINQRLLAPNGAHNFETRDQKCYAAMHAMALVSTTRGILGDPISKVAIANPAKTSL